MYSTSSYQKSEGSITRPFNDYNNNNCDRSFVYCLRSRSYLHQIWLIVGIVVVLIGLGGIVVLLQVPLTTTTSEISGRTTKSIGLLTLHDDRRKLILDALQQLQNDIDGTVYFHPTSSNSNFQGSKIVTNIAFVQAAEVYYSSLAEGNQAPFAIVEVSNDEDVQKAMVVLSHLRTVYSFPFRIRSGGHNKGGFSTVAGGAVLSLKRMNHVSVEINHPNKNDDDDDDDQIVVAVARMQPAVLVRQFLTEVLATYGYGGVVGYCGTVAEAGFILGGGLGLQSRLYGLGLDNVLGMRIVLADGTVRYVSNESKNPLDVDLFWALRGAGGGSFGVVTELEYQIHKSSDRMIYSSLHLENPLDMAIFLYRLGQREDDLPRNLMVMHDHVDGVELMWSGQDDTDFENATTYMANLVNELVPLQNAEHVFHQTEYIWSQAFANKSDPWSVNVYAVRCWYGFLFPENNTLAIWQDIMTHISRGVTNNSSSSSGGFLLPDIELWGGAIHDVPPHATAFPHRRAIFNVGVLPHADQVFQVEGNKVDQWWPHVEKYLTGSYVNYPTTTLLQQQQQQDYYAHAHWGDNLSRLVDIKRRVDPKNVFEFPMSVPIIL
jgi:FAD/FMN-containing dehydrogenase